jgi:hypothetical protein
MPKTGVTTTESKALFLEGIHRGMTVTKAAKHAHVDRTTPYDWENTDPDFRRHWDEARATRPRMIVDKAFEIGLQGNVPMLKFMLQYQRTEHQEPRPVEVRIIPQEVLPDGSHQDFITTGP